MKLYIHDWIVDSLLIKKDEQAYIIIPTQPQTNTIEITRKKEIYDTIDQSQKIKIFKLKGEYQYHYLNIKNQKKLRQTAKIDNTTGKLCLTIR